MRRENQINMDMQMMALVFGYLLSVIAWSPAVRVNPGSEQAKGKVITRLSK